MLAVRFSNVMAERTQLASRKSPSAVKLSISIASASACPTSPGTQERIFGLRGTRHGLESQCETVADAGISPSERGNSLTNLASLNTLALSSIHSDRWRKGLHILKTQKDVSIV